jgi:hypothetical protein
MSFCFVIVRPIEGGGGRNERKKKGRRDRNAPNEHDNIMKRDERK